MLITDIIARFEDFVNILRGYKGKNGIDFSLKQIYNIYAAKDGKENAK